MKNHLIVDGSKCTGCGACASICPAKAISFVQDKCGFPFPEVAEEKCISCGKCFSVCQLKQEKTSHELVGAYAVQHKDNQVLKESSSGGVFSAAAEYIFAKHGIVYGCEFDDSCVAVYKSASSMEEIRKMRGSKYVWADAHICYKQVEADLKENKSVLFCGLPCQISGLLLYLGRSYENLYTMDFLCGGPPSPYVFQEYIVSFTKPEERKNLEFKFRDKEKHGTGYCISYRLKNKKYYKEAVQSPYLYLFSNKMVQREACYHCVFRGTHRNSDITMGDFWGAEKYLNNWDVKAGVSFLLINSEKGRNILEFVQTICKVEKIDPSYIAKHNVLRLDDSVKEITVPSSRDAFFASLRKNGWKRASLQYTLTGKRIKAMIRKMIK